MKNQFLVLFVLVSTVSTAAYAQLDPRCKSFYGGVERAFCETECAHTLWNGHLVDPASCGACTAGAGAILAGSTFAEAVTMCQSLASDDSRSEKGLAALCIGAASKAKVACVVE